MCSVLLYFIRWSVQLYLRVWSGDKIMYVNKKHPSENSSKYKGHPEDGRPASWEPCRLRHELNSGLSEMFVIHVAGANECCLLYPGSRHRYGFSRLMLREMPKSQSKRRKRRKQISFAWVACAHALMGKITGTDLTFSRSLHLRKLSFTAETAEELCHVAPCGAHESWLRLESCESPFQTRLSRVIRSKHMCARLWFRDSDSS
jgi:hypothetical protein